MNAGTRKAGRVYLVGAGPGDPELLTLKARRVLDEANVIYYDALVGRGILYGVSARCIFVGKRRGFQVYSQEEINRFLAEAAERGERVVRLKGGDPLVFGRGGEELLYLRARGVACEVVPGISAAFAAAASLELPLTHRGLSASVVFATGSPADRVAIPDADTKVFYMAARSAGRIAAAAIERGLPPDAPVALVHNASLPDERHWIVSARELAEGRDVAYPSPLLIVIGRVVEIARGRGAEGAAPRGTISLSEVGRASEAQAAASGRNGQRVGTAGAGTGARGERPVGAAASGAGDGSPTTRRSTNE